MAETVHGHNYGVALHKEIRAKHFVLEEMKSIDGWEDKANKLLCRESSDSAKTGAEDSEVGRESLCKKISNSKQKTTESPKRDENYCLLAIREQGSNCDHTYL